MGRNYYTEKKKWIKREGCSCLKCREVEYEVVRCNGKDDDHEKKYAQKDSCGCNKCRENEDIKEKIVINVECNNDHDKKDDDKKHDDKKHDDKKHDDKKHDDKKVDGFEGKKLEAFTDQRVSIFTKGSWQIEGTVDEVKKGFVALVATPFPNFEPVEVFGNDGNIVEALNRAFVRLDSIEIFGLDTSDTP